MEALKQIPRDGSISAKDLAFASNADEQVISLSQHLHPVCGADILVRLMRQLTASGIVESVSENVYIHTRFSLAYIDRSEVEFLELV